MTGASETKRRRDLFLGGLILAVMTVLFIAGCSESGTGSVTDEHAHHADHDAELYEETSGFDVLPVFLQDYTANTAARYARVSDYADYLKAINCYCGCMAYGAPHESLYRCYIAGTKADGSVTWSDHSANCGICLMEFDDIIKLADEGKSIDEVRTAIDAKYA